MMDLEHRQNISFTKVAETCLSPETDHQIAALIDSIYGVDFQGRSYCHQPHHMRYLAHYEGKLVGHLAALSRSVRLGDKRVLVTGVAEVATDKAFRRQGIASHLLGLAIEDAKRNASRFVCLFGTERIYAQAGFEAASNPITAIDIRNGNSNGAYQVTNEPLMVLSVKDEAWDFSAALDLLGPVF